MSADQFFTSSLVLSGLELLPQGERVFEIVRRHLAARGGVQVQKQGESESALTLSLSLDVQLGPESFCLSFDRNQATLRAGDQMGLTHGLGKFLRACRFEPNGLYAPAALTIEEIRETPVIRGMYFASHFHNYYHDAPVDEINRYVEDLALWGMNTLQVWFDMHHYTGIQDPAAQTMIERLRAILLAAKAIGVRAALVQLGNEAYAGSPQELRADYKTGRAVYEVELCPHKSGATELMLQWHDEVLQAFADVSPDYLVFGPYDQGGCACEQCRPWGVNGYLKIVEAKARHARQRFPQLKVILSTWLFDYGHDQGEWAGLDQAFRPKPDWCDYIQADSHTTFPTYPLENGVPGGLPLLNFPEISMWMMYPWGGFGANPLAKRFSGLFETVKPHIAGGFPYSEGIYEDLNKVLWLQWYGDPQRSAESILREYTGYEFSPDVEEEVLETVAILEENHNHYWMINQYFQRSARIAMEFPGDAHLAWQKMQNANEKLSDAAKVSWRWRILYLRALIDAQLEPTQGFWGNEICERAMEELTEIYHAQNAEYKCAPPTVASIAAMRSSEIHVTN
jgi:hypothetical protein